MDTGSATVDGWKINLPSQGVAVRRILDAASARECFSVFTLNLDHLVKLRHLPEFRRAYRSAKFVTADGAPVAKLARRECPSLKTTTGADLLLPLCKGASERGLPVFLFGSSKEVLDATAQALRSATSDKLSIAGYDAPPADFDPRGAQADKFISQIRRSGCALCFIFLGAPKQELFATRAVEQGLKVGFLCVGAAADFIAGTQVRAPLAWRELGVEWLWRLLHNPRRLLSRYFACALLLAELRWSAWHTA